MDFGQQVAAFARKANQANERTVRGTAVKLWSAIIYATPVDSGRARGNWFASTGQPSIKTSDSTDKQGSTTVSNATTQVLGSVTWDEFILTNNLPYAEVLEFGGYKGDGPNTANGYSKQAPAGIVRVNVKRFQRLIDEEARINRV